MELTPAAETSPITTSVVGIRSGPRPTLGSVAPLLGLTYSLYVTFSAPEPCSKEVPRSPARLRTSLVGLRRSRVLGYTSSGAALVMASSVTSPPV